MSSSERLLKRQGTYYYHRRVPIPLIALLGRDIIKSSLRTKSLAVARQKRALSDVYWDAQFAAVTAHAPTSLCEDVPKSQIEELVRDYVQRGVATLATNLELRPPSQMGRYEMMSEAEQQLTWLERYDEPDGAELIGRTFEKVFGGKPLTLEKIAVDLTRRALVEFEKRKLATLEGQFPDFYDPLFDPKRKPTTTFGEIADQFLTKRSLEDQHNGLQQKTKDKWAVRVQLIIELIGRDTPISDVDYDRCEATRSRLARIPANRSKLYPNLSIEQASAAAADEGKSTISLTTQSDYWGALRSILDFATAKGVLANNPSATLKPLGTEVLRADEKKLPFTVAQLTSFFASSIYAQVAANRGSSLHGPTRGWRFWLPLLCLFHGFRGREAAQLLLGDIKRTDQGTWYFDVTDKGPGGDTKSVKNASSRRRVPIHPEVIKIGFLDYIDARKSDERTARVFGKLKVNKYGDPGAYLQRRFNETYLSEGMDLDDRQSFHSFRHTFRDALRRTNAPPDVLRVAGWSVSRSSSDNYGTEQDNPDLTKVWMSAVCYPGLDLSPLHGFGGTL